MKLNKHKLIYIWPQLKYLKIQVKDSSVRLY